jgi:hypothetical protein
MNGLMRNTLRTKVNPSINLGQFYAFPGFTKSRWRWIPKFFHVLVVIRKGWACLVATLHPYDTIFGDDPKAPSIFYPRLLVAGTNTICVACQQKKIIKSQGGICLLLQARILKDFLVPKDNVLMLSIDHQLIVC